VTSARPPPPCACVEVVREPFACVSGAAGCVNVNRGPLVLRDGNPCGGLCVSFELAHLVLQFLCRAIHFQKSTPGTPTDLYVAYTPTSGIHTGGFWAEGGRPRLPPPHPAPRTVYRDRVGQIKRLCPNYSHSDRLPIMLKGQGENTALSAVGGLLIGGSNTRTCPDMPKSRV